MLTALQQRLAAMIAELPESEGFALAGAAALLAHGLIDRPTLDLDFFACPAEEAQVQELAAAIEQAVAAAGMHSVRRRDLRSFVRREVSDGDQRWKSISPSITAPSACKTASTVRPRSLLAVFDRAEPRDFRDLAAVTQRFSLGRLCELAREQDIGFDLSHLQQALRSFGRLTREDLAIDEDEHRHLIRRRDRAGNQGFHPDVAWLAHPASGER
ncbi:MAG: nucleotidyl transferase AbiEii/AbiGii toxin family protein [Egibacteraceae bacterium]